MISQEKLSLNKKTKIPYLHIIMFVFTFFTILLAGAWQQGADFIKYPVKIFEGLPFSISLICILLAHELSHYFASRSHGITATLPLFIPAPPPVIFGTFGAFIKMKSPILSKKALIDIGASGPIGGFIVSLIATIIGLRLSDVVSVSGATGGINLGESLIFHALSYITLGHIPDGYDVVLNPIAFAGWIGFFVTAINLIPVGQLDGGHIAYAMLGNRHRGLSILLMLILITAGAFFWPGWLVWSILLIILGINHPPVIQDEVQLDRKRKYIGILCLIIFILTITPVPFSLKI
ncbi:MAG TPA: site-2 protease family protein [Nitrospirae bacterium]|nr:site-2 protease family protein [Nitrospirota bacterium]HDO21950.1 site-2 protease family protein [Nitrospirota bacterium]HDZ88966.1 site-2 protease family protein [Nitrospirota bacterium]